MANYDEMKGNIREKDNEWSDKAEKIGDCFSSKSENYKDKVRRREEIKNSCCANESKSSYSGEDTLDDKYRTNTPINNENNTSYGPNGYQGEIIVDRANEFIDDVDGLPTDYRSRMQTSVSDVIDMGRDRIDEEISEWRSRKTF
ncbi:MAG: hypothetical protein LIO79_08845 [Rikenellaceae bacterium]|nr:hypothetical protein [Rikenellaceae bacterium]